MNKRLPMIALACLCLLLGTACGLIYKQNIQQGNALEQEDLDQLAIGMTKNQVSFLLGTPAIQDPFNQDRWDYVSTFSRRGGDPVRRLVTLRFENDRLVTMDGVDPEGSEEILTLEGPERLPSAATPAALDAEDARNDEDIVTFTPGEGIEHWTLQIGAFSSRSEANLRVARLREAGVEATVYGQVNGNSAVFIVRSGEFGSYEEAVAGLERVEALSGFRAFIVTPGG